VQQIESYPGQEEPSQWQEARPVWRSCAA